MDLYPKETLKRNHLLICNNLKRNYEWMLRTYCNALFISINVNRKLRLLQRFWEEIGDEIHYVSKSSNKAWISTFSIYLTIFHRLHYVISISICCINCKRNKHDLYVFSYLFVSLLLWRRIELMNGQMSHVVFKNLSSRSRFMLFGLVTLIPDSSRPGVGSSYYFDRTSVIILWFLYWSGEKKVYLYTLV